MDVVHFPDWYSELRMEMLDARNARYFAHRVSLRRMGPYSTDILVLGTVGNLWLEHAPFGTLPPPRQQVDGNVRAFQALALSEFVWVLGTDGNLCLEQAPWGNVPPSRQQIDGNVA